MGTKYDEKTKLWINSDNKQFNIVDVSNSQWIWQKLLEHGPKVAQVRIVFICELFKIIKIHKKLFADQR